MKTFIKTILQLSLFATLLFGMGAIADASGFVSNPRMDEMGTTIVGSTEFSIDADDSLSLPGGNSFYAFISYQNGTESYIVNDVKAQFDFPTSGTGPSVTIKGMLNSDDAGTETDTAVVTGLPDAWSISMVSAYVQNFHGTTSGTCSPEVLYTYEISVSTAGLSNSWVTLPGGANDLDLEGVSDLNGFKGACDQGHVVARFKVTEILDDVDDPDVDVTPIIRTEDATSVGPYGAQLNGTIILGSVTDPYFIWSPSPSISCYAVGATVYGTFNAVEDFDNDIGGLLADNTYYFKACGIHGAAIISGVTKSFTTDSIDGGGDGSDEEPDATTHSADNVDEDSAELNGYVDMNDFENGDVFFVWGESESAVEDVEDENSYDDIDTDGDNLRKEMVDGDLDGSSSYNLDIEGLDPDDHYFRICVDYYDDGDQMVCGNVKHFNTGDDYPDDDGDSVIETRDVEVGSTSAKICGDLIYNGGDSALKTWMEYKRSDLISWNSTAKLDRNEIYYCVTVTGLEPGTSYQYRASSEDDDGATRSFRTVGELPSEALARPLVSTNTPTNIRSNSAILNGYYVSNADSLNVWFNYGRTALLGKQTQTYDKFGANGSMSHNFTGLAANTTYFYQAVARNAKGTAAGNILSFRTGAGEGSVVVVKETEEPFDLAKLGLGLSLVRLDIDDDREQVVRGENIEYVITWENISTLNLDNIDLKVTLPEEVEITNTSRGIFDADQNAIFYTINDLDDGEDGELTIFGIVNGGVLGSALTAEATIAFNNPVNDAQENATDYDVDELVVRGNLGTASVFGLSNISFLGWLVILLGLLIIFLVARWLYLEREELRAQAYAGGYGRPMPAPAYNYAPPVQATPVYQAPAPTYQAPAAPAPTAPAADPGYKPYKPNR